MADVETPSLKMVESFVCGIPRDCCLGPSPAPIPAAAAARAEALAANTELFVIPPAAAVLPQEGACCPFRAVGEVYADDEIPCSLSLLNPDPGYRGDERLESVVARL